jgi:hypothetical protein
MVGATAQGAARRRRDVGARVFDLSGTLSFFVGRTAPGARAALDHCASVLAGVQLAGHAALERERSPSNGFRWPGPPAETASFGRGTPPAAYLT